MSIFYGRGLIRKLTKAQRPITESKKAMPIWHGLRISLELIPHEIFQPSSEVLRSKALFFAGFRPGATRHSCFGKSGQNHFRPCAAPPRLLRSRLSRVFPPRPTQQTKCTFILSIEKGALGEEWLLNVSRVFPTLVIRNPGFLNLRNNYAEGRRGGMLNTDQI